MTIAEANVETSTSSAVITKHWQDKLLLQCYSVASAPAWTGTNGRGRGTLESLCDIVTVIWGLYRRQRCWPMINLPTHFSICDCPLLFTDYIYWSTRTCNTYVVCTSYLLLWFNNSNNNHNNVNWCQENKLTMIILLVNLNDTDDDDPEKKANDDYGRRFQILLSAVAESIWAHIYIYIYGHRLTIRMLF